MSAGSITKLVETLVAAGCTPDMILAAVRTAEATKDAANETLDAANEERKEKARARFHKWKANKAANVSQRQPTTANVSQQLARADDAPDLENKQTNKQGKKENKTPREELALVLDAEHADAVLDHRNRLRKPLSQRAAHLLAASLASCPDPNAAADQMIESGWLKIKPDWLQSRSRQNGHGPPNGKRQNAVEAMEEIFRDKGWTNEPEFIPSDNGDAQCLPPERRDDQGTVVDLRPGTDWRHRHGHQ